MQKRALLIFTFTVFFIIFAGGYKSSSVSSLSLNTNNLSDWCVDVGSGVPIILEIPPNFTPEEVMENLGFNTQNTNWTQLLQTWNRGFLKITKGKPIKAKFVRACYYWREIEIWDSCTDKNGNLTVCYIRSEWIPIYPSEKINWYLPYINMPKLVL